MRRSFRLANLSPQYHAAVINKGCKPRKHETCLLFASHAFRRYYTSPATNGTFTKFGKGPLIPISIDEFRGALDQIYQPVREPKQPCLFALAVSGGVDSTCLAYLAQKLEVQHPNLYRFTALVVDHKARPGSTEEAYAVQRSLQSRGLPTSVLDITWPANASKPLERSNFETEARKLRYRALGLECRRLNIRHLLLAHHEEDQAETVLGRVVQGYDGRGLAVMAPLAHIPECHGIVGVDEIPQPSSPRRLATATRGVLILRPLLGFSKELLRLTCQKSGISWKEDETNDDRTLTLRNTTRHLLKMKSLPAALNKTSLLNLSKTMQNRIKRREKEGVAALCNFDYLNLDLRSGKIVMSFSPYRLFPDLGKSPDFDWNEAVQTMAAAMTYIAQAATPFESIKHRQMVQLATQILPNQTHPNSDSAEKGSHSVPTTFTLAGLLWQKEYLVRSGEPIWTVTRQPHNWKNLQLDATIKRPRCIWSKASGEGKDDHQTGPGIVQFGSWQLFDGRFWIRVKDSVFQSVIARPFEESDMEKIRSEVGRAAQQDILRRLKLAAPERCRWTLPVIADSITDRAMALPTLGKMLIRREEGHVDWDVQYKHVEMPYRHIQQLIRGRQKISDNELG